MPTQIGFDSRYQGPFGNVNGGYLAGVRADAVGEAHSSVRLRRPVPVDQPVYLAVQLAGRTRPPHSRVA